MNKNIDYNVLFRKEIVEGIISGKYVVHFDKSNLKDEINIFTGSIIKGDIYFVILNVKGKEIIRACFSKEYYNLINLVKKGEMKFENDKFISLN